MKRALPIGVALLLGPAPALAQSLPASSDSTPQAALDPDAPPSTVHLVDDSEPKAPFLPPAPDLLGQHLLLGAAVSPTWALGKLGGDTSATDRLGTGIGVRLDASFGLSRVTTFGVWGGFAAYGDGSACAGGCAGKAWSVGPFLRYHLTQGLRLDPWLALGASYRQLSYEPPSGPREKFSGVEWLRLELGANYYALSGLGFGPYGALGLSSYHDRPSSAGAASVSPELSVGLRVLLDVPGR